MADSKLQDHWYMQLKSVSVPPQVAYTDWGDAFEQRVKGLLMPTTSRAFTEKAKYFEDRFDGEVEEYTKVLMLSPSLQFLVSRSYRHSQFNEIVSRLQLPEPPAQWNDEIDNGVARATVPQNVPRNYDVIAVPTIGNSEQNPPASTLEHAQRNPSEDDIKLLDQYCASIERTRILRSHLEDVDEDLENYAQTLSTQATAECTYFRGFRDWCQIMLQLTNSLSTSLIAVSTLGAGLVYSTIFGATRGNIGLMCYSFPFFSCGFLLPVIIQLVLQWGASLQKEVKFASQQFWTIVIGIFMAISSLSVIASLTILNLTVFLLKTDPDDTIPDPPSTPVPGIIAFSITGTIFLLMLTGVLLTAIARRAFATLKGMRAIVSAMYGGKSGHADALKVWLPV
ncbi:hypothetical protein B0H17DRAFT_1200163 [Mycena rosella]|uniref:Uncharacterized protein n=1 Tax=Mycena rosella TaxID=1033263 RepID=A0AAD7GKD0_MYCRO|nr:hypothetical protein B0H17DRAFT_1200163 [Mycena rosella]